MFKETTEHQQPLSREQLDITLANMFSGEAYRDSYMFYGYMIGQCSIHLERMPYSAAVSFQHDHYVLHINPEKFDTHTLEERLFILQHEMHHILNGHLIRLEDRDMRAFNYATDCAINQLGNPNHMPQGSIVPANFPSKHKVPDKASAEQYYELFDHSKLPEEDDSEIDNGKGGGHGKWSSSVGEVDLQNDLTKSMIEKAINETQKARGNVPQEISKYLSLFHRARELDWKKVLKGIVGNKKVNSRRTILRKDRRNPDFDHIKGRTKDRMFDLLIIGDESGSVSDNALSIGVNESLGVCKVTKTPAWYIAVDTTPSEPRLLKENIKKFTRTHSGGTNLSPAIEMAKKHRIPFKAIVVVTDGELCSSDVATFNALNIPIIWIIEPTGTIMPEMQQGRSKAFKLKSS